MCFQEVGFFYYAHICAATVMYSSKCCLGPRKLCVQLYVASHLSRRDTSLLKLCSLQTMSLLYCNAYVALHQADIYYVVIWCVLNTLNVFNI